MCLAVDSVVTLKYICCISCSCSCSASLVLPCPPKRGLVLIACTCPIAALCTFTLSICGRLYYPRMQSFLWNRLQRQFNLHNPARILLFWPVGSHSNTYLPSYMACSCSILNISVFTTEMAHDKVLANSKFPREAANPARFVRYGKYSLFYKALKMWFVLCMQTGLSSEDGGVGAGDEVTVLRNFLTKIPSRVWKEGSVMKFLINSVLWCKPGKRSRQ